MIADPTERSAIERALVDTYDPRSYQDPWDAIEDFERVQRAAARFPEKGSAALSQTVELPRGRIRTWLDGGMPDPYRGLDIARRHGWLPDEWNSMTARRLNVLATWILASGSIADNWRPSFVVDGPQERSIVRSCLGGLGLRTRVIHDDTLDRATELIPRDGGTVLGRLLSVWSGIQHAKDPTSVALPRYLGAAPAAIRRDFARVYVSLRGVERREDPDRSPFIQISVQRDASFRQSLADLLREVVEDTDAIRATAWPIRIYEPGASHLFQWPNWLVERTTDGDPPERDIGR